MGREIKMKIAYDTELMRPGCVLLQATLGCDYHLAHEFETQYWLLAPTDNLRVFELTKDQLKRLVKMTEARAKL